MIPTALLALPSAAGTLSLLVPRLAARTTTLIGVALVHLVLVGWLWVRPGPLVPGAWLGVDALGLLVLTLLSVTFTAVAGYAVSYRRRRSLPGGRAFIGCLLLLLAAGTLVCLSQHMALLWVGLGAVTLSVAPLIYHEDDPRSLEAAWKYLLLSSVGIALALLGTFLLATAQQSGIPLLFGDMVRGASTLHVGWLQAAFVFLLLGYGLKIGLAPLHTWKPDTYGEAPGLVGALMAADVTACAFLGLARVTAIGRLAGIGPFMQPLLIGFGLVSLGVAAVFMLGQRDFKRLLAYSSVEHMGLMVLGLGVGGVGSFGALFHLLGNGLAKAIAFLVASNLVLATGSATLGPDRALLKKVPFSTGLLLTSLFALSGSPPFGTFLSALIILGAVWAGPYSWAALPVCLGMALAFVPMAARVLEAAYGEGADSPHREGTGLTWIPLALAVALALLGILMPARLREVLDAATLLLGGRRP